MIDVRRLVAPIAPIALLASIGATPALAIGTGQHLTALHTTEVDVDHPHGAVEGTLNIAIDDNGRISGYFRVANTPLQLDVRGGLDGGTIYLNIAGQPQINGYYTNGEIHGYVSASRDLLQFTAVPAAEQTT